MPSLAYTPSWRGAEVIKHMISSTLLLTRIAVLVGSMKKLRKIT
jgi:hypothetical protein